MQIKISPEPDGAPDEEVRDPAPGLHLEPRLAAHRDDDVGVDHVAQHQVVGVPGGREWKS